MLGSEKYIQFVTTIPSILPRNPHFWLHCINVYGAQLHLTAALCFISILYIVLFENCLKFCTRRIIIIIIIIMVLNFISQPSNLHLQVTT